MSATILERVETWMRERGTTVELADVIEAFPGEQPKVVRLTLGALRRQEVLSASVEGGKAFYCIVKDAQRSDAPPLRKDEKRIATPHAPAPEERVLNAMRVGEKDFFTVTGLLPVVKMAKQNLSKTLKDLEALGKVFGAGEKTRKRYSLKPFPANPRPTLLPVLERPPREVAPEHIVDPMPAVRPFRPAGTQEPPETEPIATVGHGTIIDRLLALGVSDAVIDQVFSSGESPRFAYWSDGGLQIDCPECSGVLRRRDLEAFRAFVNELPPLRGE